MRSLWLPSTTTILLPLLVFACESTAAPPPAFPDRIDGSSPTGLPPGSSGTARCPSFPPEQSAPCNVARLRCEWSDNVVGTTVAICDGQFWRIGERDRDCAATLPAGRCGSYSGHCGYLVDGPYPSSFSTAMDTCIADCFCRDGLWECDSSCKCPGKPTEDPELLLTISRKPQGACLHPSMQCNYTYRIGQDFPGRSTTGQPCQTSYTCSADGRWQQVDMCSCPSFTPGQRGYVFECRSEGLRCEFPGAEDGAPSRTCTCQDGSWACPF